MGRIQRAVFGISELEATFERRGFRVGNDAAHARLEHVGRTFIAGHNEALEEPRAEWLGARLARFGADRGFAFEGAAMAAALLDALIPGGRWNALRERAPEHVYMLHVGAGWAAARLPWVRRRIERYVERFDPVLRWLVVDGFGFHEGYFKPRTTIREQRVPDFASNAARRAFDEGLGRAMWFVECGDAGRIGRTVDMFAAERRPDLWAGIGLAASYAGIASVETLNSLRARAGVLCGELAQGAAFAAKARQLAGLNTDHTTIACEVLCGCSSSAAAFLCDQTYGEMVASGTPDYQMWRRTLSRRLATFSYAAAR
jgi:hypothetical protein